MNNKNAKFDPDNIHPIKMTLLEEQAEIILRTLELYAYNLEYMLIICFISVIMHKLANFYSCIFNKNRNYFWQKSIDITE